MNKRTLIGLILVVAALLAAPALAKRHGFSEGSDQESRQMERIGHLTQILGLAPEQEADIREIVDQSRQDAGQHRETAEANRREVRQLLASDSLDEARLRALIHEQAEMKVDRMIERHRVRAAINRTLTPEQQQKLKALSGVKRSRKGPGKQMAYNR